MGKRQITYYFIGVVVAAIIVFDVWVILTGGIESSISHVLIEFSYDYPAMPFSLGFVCGHLFWRLKSTKQLKKVVGEE